MSLVREQRFSSVFAFKYSPRPGTAAPRLGGDVERGGGGPAAAGASRRPAGDPEQLNRRLEGDVLDVLVTGWGREAATQSGRTPCHRIVHFPVEAGGAPLGRILPIVIERGNPEQPRRPARPP